MEKTINIAVPIELYSDADDTLAHLIETAQKIFPNTNINMDPIFVSSKELIGFIKLILPEKIKNIRHDIKENFKLYVETQFNKKNMSAPKKVTIIESFTESRRSQTNKFINYINQKAYDVILLQTSPKQSLDRVVDGSFTEALVRNSRTPIICVNKFTETKGASKALIPLELNEKSRVFAIDFVNSKTSKMFDKIEFFHSIQISDFDEITWAVSPYNKEKYDYSGMIDRAEKKVKQFMSCLIEQVSDNSAIDFSYSSSKKLGSLDDEIMKRTQTSNADIVILRSNLYPIHIPFISTNTTSILNRSQVPILVYPLFSQNDKFFL